ncbi:MAG: MarR family transcriptional regulator [Thermosynechococcaceae cyanobacterium]
MAFDAVDEVLAQWQKERPDLDASPMEVMGRMARLAKHLERSLEEVFSGFGLNGGEFDVLATLRRSGPPYQLSPTALFNSMMVSSGTMTHRIDQLEKSELVERIPDLSDRRGTLIHLTNKGFSVIEKAVEAHVANGEKILSVLEQPDHDALAELLRKLLVSFED